MTSARRRRCRVGVVNVSPPSEETDTRTRRPHRVRHPLVTQLLPRGRCSLLAPGGQVFWLGDQPPPVPSRPCGSGRDRVRPPLQLRGSEGFSPSSLARLGSRGLIRSASRAVNHLARAAQNPHDTVAYTERPGSGKSSASRVWSLVRLRISNATRSRSIGCSSKPSV